jgi:hypothetical protein
MELAGVGFSASDFHRPTVTRDGLGQLVRWSG